MKKTLLAIAVLGAAAMTAQAANVTLYGGVDGGVFYKNAKQTLNGAVVGAKESSFKLADGIDGANKFGLKGEEDLGNMKVGFQLENGFHIANGALNKGGKIFDREARLYVKGAFGEVAAGRFGGLASAAGSYNIFFKNADAFDGGDNDVPYAFATSTRYDNSLVYQSPEFAGLQGTLMYSFQKEGDQAAKFKDNNRYAGFGLTYKHDQLTLVGTVEGQIRASVKDQNKQKKPKNGMTYSLGGNYDFDVAKLYTGAQIARNTNLGDIKQGIDFAGLVNKKQKLEGDNLKKAIDSLTSHQFNGYAFTLGTQIPFGANNVTLGAYYGRYKNAVAIEPDSLVMAKAGKKEVKMTIYGLAGRYEYSLSKRTTVYAGAGIGQTKFTAPETTIKDKVAQVYAGLHHNF